MQIQATLLDENKIKDLIIDLNNIDKNKVIKQGLRDATALFVRSGRTNLKSRMKNKKGVTGNLLNSFRNKVKRMKLGSIAGFNGFGPHAHLVDLGTDKRTTEKGYNRGKVEGNNFWTDAIKQNESQAIDKVYEGIERGIQKIMNRN